MPPSSVAPPNIYRFLPSLHCFVRGVRRDGAARGGPELPLHVTCRLQMSSLTSCMSLWTSRKVRPTARFIAGPRYSETDREFKQMVRGLARRGSCRNTDGGANWLACLLTKLESWRP